MSLDMPPRPDASMSLLVDLWTDALDPGYAEAAARRRRTPGPATDRPWLLAAGLIAATLIVVVAAVQARVGAPAAARNRAALAAQVQHESGAVAGLVGQVSRLRVQIGQLRDSSLQGSAQGARLASTLRRAELLAGTVAVRGPGLRVTLDDAATRASGGTPRNRVLDHDLQLVVNALWAGGAEAISVGGQRLTAQSSIRQAGDAILVNFAPLRAPYIVDAVGDPVALETSFGQSSAVQRMRSYEQLYGLRFGYRRASSLQLSASAEEQLAFARPLPGTGRRP